MRQAQEAVMFKKGKQPVVKSKGPTTDDAAAALAGRSYKKRGK